MDDRPVMPGTVCMDESGSGEYMNLCPCAEGQHLLPRYLGEGDM